MHLQRTHLTSPCLKELSASSHRKKQTNQHLIQIAAHTHTRTPHIKKSPWWILLSLYFLLYFCTLLNDISTCVVFTNRHGNVSPCRPRPRHHCLVPVWPFVTHGLATTPANTSVIMQGKPSSSTYDNDKRVKKARVATMSTFDRIYVKTLLSLNKIHAGLSFQI